MNNKDLIERLKSNIKNLNIFIDEQKNLFQDQQNKFKENEDFIKKAQDNLDQLVQRNN